MKIELKYIIYERTDDGILKHPKTYWGDYVYNQYGYDSQEDALRAISAKLGIPTSRTDGLLIVPVTSVVADWGE